MQNKTTQRANPLHPEVSWGDLEGPGFYVSRATGNGLAHKLGKIWDLAFAGIVLCVATPFVARANSVPIYRYQAGNVGDVAVHPLLDSGNTYGSENAPDSSQRMAVGDLQSYTSADSSPVVLSSSAPLVEPNARTGMSAKQGVVSDNKGSASFIPVDYVALPSSQSEFSSSNANVYEGPDTNGLAGTSQVGGGLHASTTTPLFDVAGNNGNGGHHHLGRVFKLNSDTLNPVDSQPAAVPEPGALGPALAALTIFGVVLRKRRTTSH